MQERPPNAVKTVIILVNTFAIGQEMDWDFDDLENLKRETLRTHLEIIVLRSYNAV